MAPCSRSRVFPLFFFSCESSSTYGMTRIVFSILPKQRALAAVSCDPAIGPAKRTRGSSGTRVVDRRSSAAPGAGLVPAGARVINSCNTVQSDARSGDDNSANTLAQSGSTVCSASLHRSGPAKRPVASNSPTDSGDDDGKRNDHIYGKMVDATLMKPGQRYLTFAPGTDRTAARGGERRLVDAGIGVLSLSGVDEGRTHPIVEFRRCLDKVTTSRYTWGAVRDVARDELCDFRFRKQLDTATAPLVDVQRCASESTVFAVAVGLLQPEDRSSKGLLSGCKNVGWPTVRQLRKAFNNKLPDISSLSHVNTFRICWPISYAFIDYRPGASATIFVHQHHHRKCDNDAS
eukprot:COSAG01_NODE_11505_length_1919_cov_10.892857_2_plen_347_part_00